MKGITLFATILAASLAFSHVVHAQEGAAAPAASPVVAPQPQPTSPPPAPGPSGKGLIIGGWITFGVLYLPHAIWGVAAAMSYGPAAVFVIPAVGPIIVGAMTLAAGGLYGETVSGEAESMVKGLGVFFLIWGILESGGLAMAITGHVLRARYKASVGARLEEYFYPKKKVGFRVTPLVGRDNIGVGLVGWF